MKKILLIAVVFVSCSKEVITQKEITPKYEWFYVDNGTGSACTASDRWMYGREITTGTTNTLK